LGLLLQGMLPCPFLKFLKLAFSVCYLIGIWIFHVHCG
jgi:hypothetical protein